MMSVSASNGRMLIALLVACCVAPAVFAQGAGEAGSPPERILVAPLPPPAVGAAEDPIHQALPALIAEAVSADRVFTASLAHDLSPDALEALGMKENALPDAAALSSETASKPLVDEGVRILVLPSIEPASGGGQASSAPNLTLVWRDLVADKSGRVTEGSSSAGGLVEAAGRAVNGARRAWSAGFKPARPTGTAAGAPRPLGEITSKSGAALSAWARAGVAWNRGDVPAAEAALAEAISADKTFDQAKVDLAWIRLAQGRASEAASLASGVLKLGRLSAASRSRAEIVAAAGRGDAAALETLARRLDKEAPSAPWGGLAGGIAKNIKGDHDPAVAMIDRVRLHRPNDPAILHHAAMAALGSEDPAEAVGLLERAAKMWPQNDRIMGDLAEAHVRNHDLDGARRVLESWRERYKPGDPPVWGGEWGIQDPPPPVMATGVGLLTGSVSKTIDALVQESAALEAAKAPVGVRLSVLHTIHEFQTELAFGSDLVRQRWLNAARESFRSLTELMPQAENQRRPWVLLRLEALLRVREGRVREAGQIRKKIMAGSSLPGYDPAVEAEIDAAITLKEAETDKHFEACLRAVQARGAIEDLYRLATAYLIARRYKEADEQYLKIEERIERWSNARRRDALLYSPRTALLVPLSYSLGGVLQYWQGNVELTRARWAKFLAYFRAPDPAFTPFYVEAKDSGCKPAW